MASEMKFFTESDIVEAVAMYAAFYGIEEEAVEVTRNFLGDTENIIGFRLSRDRDGGQHGDDETHGQW